MATSSITPRANPRLTPAPGTLNVFLHGLCGIVERDTGLEILLPDMGASHVYRVGEFFGEATLQPSPAPYCLTGVVEDGSARFDPKLNLVAKGVLPVSHPKLYARIQLPPPVSIHSVRPLDLTDVIVDPENRFAGKTTTMVQVLTYTYTDFRQVMFGSAYSNIAPLEGQDGAMYMNFHVFTEEDEERPDDHTVSGFDAVVQLFQFRNPPQLIAPMSAPPMTLAEFPTGLPNGTTLIEFLDLAPRTRELAFLGREVRQSILHGQTPMVQGIGMNGHPKTCTTLIT